ncbi:hypothetical protein [Shewanella donghaensis]|uniref:hypothetical protein n=1 Tax=Shewanella donghaensis TaxID=238836 RepID=UPI001183DB85|nr:hypothetical protein [Shewanella donghaensis]
MYFVISTHTKPRYYKFDGKEPIDVDTIRLTNETLNGWRSEAVIANPMQAISELYKHQIPYFSTKKEARDMAVKHELKSFKYQKIGS